MPRYEFRCGCGQTTEAFYPVDDRPGAVTCGRCGGIAERAFTSPMVPILDDFDRRYRRRRRPNPGDGLPTDGLGGAVGGGVSRDGKVRRRPL